MDQALRWERARDYGIPALLKAVPDVDLTSFEPNDTVVAAL